MEESQEILLNSLANAGVAIPREVLSVEDLTPEALVSICAHSLSIISNSESFPISLPDSMADRFKVCTDLASSVKDLGYIGDMSFHKFLYPSKEDTYRLIRFLVGRLSESSSTEESSNPKDNDANAVMNVAKSERSSNDEGQDLPTKIEGLKLRTEEKVSNSIQHAEVGFVADDVNKGENSETEDSQHKENVLPGEVGAKSLELQNLQEQHDLLKAAVEMACDEHNPLDSHITQLNEQTVAKRHNLAKLESNWKAIIKPLEDKKRNLESAKYPEKHQKLEDLESILSETKQREEELLKLSAEVEKLPNLATRRSYIERIKEITKNSRKQDIDIEQILKETRELQLESNMIQERLHRTYHVVDETLLREAKKDQVGEQAHILLTGIHESFEEISEKILAIDRTRREMTDLETKLSRIATRSLNVDKLQADLDAIRKENDYLQSQLGNP